MITFYYACSLFFIWMEILWIVDPIGQAKEYLFIRKNKDKERTKEYKELINKKLWTIIPFIWLLLGLLTENWLMFLIFLMFNFIIINILGRLLKNNIFYYSILHWFNSIIGFFFGVVILVNYFQYKNNLTELILSYFN